MVLVEGEILRLKDVVLQDRELELVVLFGGNW